MAVWSVDLAGPLLHALVYVATVLGGGAVLFWMLFPVAGVTIARCLRWQVAAGVALLAVVEIARYAQFQLTISGGDLALAFGESMRAIYAETPGGQAAAVRFAGSCVLAAALFRSRVLAIMGIAVVIGGYLLEGHTVSSDHRLVLASLVGLHLLVAHWWLGALVPLFVLTRAADAGALHATAHKFGQIAIVLVPILIVAGAIALGILTRWQLDVSSPYQQRFAIKLGATAAILAVAGINKLLLTPALIQSPVAGAAFLRRAIGFEIFVALVILGAAAWAVSTAPVGGH